MVVAATTPFSDVKRFAEAGARIAAEHGTERARGWLQGLWYSGGLRPVTRAAVPTSAELEGGVTYHAIVLALQDAMGFKVIP
jgi:hypothetical protein